MKLTWLLFYNIWCVAWFTLIFLILYPFMWGFIQIGKPQKAHYFFQLWAQAFFFIIGKKVKKTFHFTPHSESTYVYVANHFSYLDIAVGMNIIGQPFSYVGKSSVGKIPLLGYAFKKLHIAVDRSNKNSRSLTLKRGINSLKKGQSIFIMPEGGIISQHIPVMHKPFKDGSFIMAIESQVPIVPITFKNLYEIMPTNYLKWGRPELVFHEAICTKGLTKDAVPKLKEQVYQVIQAELTKGKEAF